MCTLRATSTYGPPSSAAGNARSIITVDNQLVASTEARLAHVIDETQQRTREHALALERRVEHFFGLTQNRLQATVLSFEQRIQERLDNQFKASLTNVEASVQVAIENASSSSVASVALQLQQINEQACAEVNSTASALESKVQAKLDAALQKAEMATKMAAEQMEETLESNRAKLADEIREYVDVQNISLEKKVQAMLDASHAKLAAGISLQITKAAVYLEKHVLRVQEDNFRRAEVAFHNHLQTLGSLTEVRLNELHNTNMKSVLEMVENRAESIASQLVRRKLDEYQQMLQDSAKAEPYVQVHLITRDSQTTQASSNPDRLETRQSIDLLPGGATAKSVKAAEQRAMNSAQRQNVISPRCPPIHSPEHTKTNRNTRTRRQAVYSSVKLNTIANIPGETALESARRQATNQMIKRVRQRTRELRR